MKLTDKQSVAWHHLMSERENEQKLMPFSVLYGGAKGGGKSHFLCIWACAYAKTLIQLADLTEPQGNPICIGFIGRKRSVDFANTTLQTWKRVIPHHHYEIKEQKKLIVIDNRVSIMFGGLDDQETINKFNSAEYAFAAIDQAEECEQSDISVLFGALRLKLNGVQPKYRMLYTANPKECWLKDEFDVDYKRTTANPSCVYVPALYTDNEHLPENYSETLEKAFGYDEALLRAYKTGDWSLARDSENVITRGAIYNLKDRIVTNKIDTTVCVCDPSLGGDECVIYIVKNGEKIKEKILNTNDTMAIASEIVAFGNQNGAMAYGIDSIGIGKGITDRVRQLTDKKVYAIQSAEKSTDSRCVNMRDEVWLTLREAIQKREIPAILDQEVIAQITSIRFKHLSGKFKVEPKQAIKDRIGKSPDRGDCFAYGIWCYKKASTDNIDKARAEAMQIFGTEPDLGFMAA